MSDPILDLEQRLKNVELEIDSIGDALYRIIEDNTGSLDKLRLAGETNETLIRACRTLASLASIADECRSSRRHLGLVVQPQEEPA